MTVRAIVTDIEGTTSSIAFVHEVLFPYAAEHLPGFVRTHADDPQVAEQLDAVRREIDQDLDLDGIIDTLQEWMDTDRKVTPLKALQGMVWTDGYRRGAFQGHIYEDAVSGLQRWHAQGIALYIYSSGSVQAQKLLFAHTDAGDMTPLFSGYFDTRIGGKREPASYQHILNEIGLPPDDVLFLSDTTEELDAAAEVGMRTRQLVRDDSVQISGRHTTATSFDEISI
ncbi:MAG: acireductone synthase [Gammaproteobacteria bacterium]|jgi:enolase-phosphatase E1